MALCRLLLLNADAVLAFHWRRGQLNFEQEFHPDEAGLAAFCAYLAQHADSSFRLLADVAEENFHLESLPPVRGRDRQALLARKRSQHSHGTPYAAEIPLGREKQGRRDEIVLFAALTRYSVLMPWLHACDTSGTQVAGLYSAPQLLARLAPRLKLSNDPHLLLSLGRGGFRQTYFDRGRLSLSRLSSLAGTTTEDRIAHCAEETGKLIRHLTSQGLFKPGEYVAASILAPADEHRHWRRHCPDTAEIRYALVDSGALGNSLGCVSAAPDTSCDALLLHLLASSPPTQQFAPASTLKAHHLKQWRQSSRLAGSAALAAGLVLAMPLIWHARHLEQETKTLTAEPSPAVQQDARLVALAQALEQLPASSPLPAWLHLSQALDAAPNVELHQLDWHANDGQQPAALEILARISAQGNSTEAAIEVFRKQLEDDAWRARILAAPSPAHPSFALRLEQRNER